MTSHEETVELAEPRPKLVKRAFAPSAYFSRVLMLFRLKDTIIFLPMFHFRTLVLPSHAITKT